MLYLSTNWKQKMAAIAAEDIVHPAIHSAPAKGFSFSPRSYPQVVKYMGSKAAILPFIATELAKVHANGRPIVDLFAGACAISGGFGHNSKIISNDIQEYSAVIASVYLKRAKRIGDFNIIELATPIAEANYAPLCNDTRYPLSPSLEEFNHIERKNRLLINRDFDHSHHLFTRAYSGTWWSAEQCVWIDAIRQVLDELLNRGDLATADFNFGLTCLMHAMAYSSQGTGHYAQYRDATSEATLLDINKYRQASVPALYNRKSEALLKWNSENVIEDLNHQLSALDYRTCLAGLAEPSVVYADPPYAFVHYSRFYHAMETVVKYDYPELQQLRNEIVKGRYRTERHQSPFCIKSQVKGAFVDLFEGIKSTGSDLLLSYSNTGMINIDILMQLATSTFGSHYDVWFDHVSHTHMTMGRRNDRSRDVRESLIIAKKR